MYIFYLYNTFSISVPRLVLKEQPATTEGYLQGTFCRLATDCITTRKSGF